MAEDLGVQYLLSVGQGTFAFAVVLCAKVKQ